MRKRILSIFLLAALLMGMLPGVALPVRGEAAGFTRKCEACGAVKTWEPLTSAYALDANQPNLPGGHYYLPTDLTFGEKTILADNEVCLELNGYTYSGNRHLIMESGAVLNIQGENGTMRGRGSDNKDPGRTIWVKEGAELNLYSGTLTAQTTTTDRSANYGGVLGIYGTFNMYGGTIRDGIAEEMGGNLFITSGAIFNMYGGKILGGSAPSSPCVYSRGFNTVANDASIEHMQITQNTNLDIYIKDQLIIDGTYTGTLALRVNTLSDPGTDVGNCINNADISGADIYFNNNDMQVKVEGNELVTYLPQTARVVVDENNVTTHETLQEAVNAAQDGQTVVLQRSTEEAVSVAKNITLDLNGRKLNNTLTAESGATVAVKDSRTADYSILDGIYGKITAIDGDVVASPASEDSVPYLMIEETGGISFHAVGLNIKSMVLRPTEGGLYFKNDFAGDEMVQEKLTSFGVALSVTGAPDETTLQNPKHFTRFEADQFNAGEEVTGTLLTGILKDTNGYNTNQKYAAMDIYGRAYAEFGEGQYLFGVTRQRSLKKQVVGSHEKFAGLSTQQKDGLMQLYNGFPKILGSWELDALEAYIEEFDAAVTNVLFVSNSTCYYFTDELIGILQAAGYEDVNLCLLYYSGCSLKQHYTWYQTGEANYEFRILNKDGLTSIENYSLQDALRMYNWDVVSFDNNARSFASGDVQTSLAEAEPYFGELLTSIKRQFPNARYFWHEVWANEIGYNLAFEMKTKEQRTQVYQAKRGVAEHMQATYGVEVVPTGDAWEPVRDLELFTTPIEGLGVDRFTLNSRISYGAFKDDFTHDGDIGGGQYLNACVWFEVLTGESCLGNTFRPAYELNGIDCSLTEEKIQVLQNAAHEAVANWPK